MNIKNIIVGFAMAIVSLGSAIAADTQGCVSIDQAIHNNIEGGAKLGIKVVPQKFEKDDAVAVRNGLVKRLMTSGIAADPSQIVSFDQALLLTTGGKDTAFLILFSEGCAVSGGQISMDEATDIFKDAIGKTSAPATTAGKNEL